MVATPQAALNRPQAGPSMVAGAPSMMAGAFDDAGYALDDKFIGSGCTFIRQIPRNRLSECLEHLNGKLESGFTAECTASGLLCLLWCFTRMKPTVKITDLRGLDGLG